MDGMDGTGWDGRLSSSASLLRAPYGANNENMVNNGDDDDNDGCNTIFRPPCNPTLRGSYKSP